MKITLVQVPGGVRPFNIEIEGATVADVKELAGLTGEIRLNGDKVADDTAITDGDTITAAAPVKGAH